MKVFLLCLLFAGAWAFEKTLEFERRDELGGIRDQIKSCLGIEQWVWMTKVQTRGQVEDCVKKASGASDATAYLKCIGLKQGWYKGKTGVFRASGDNLLRCIVQSETWCPTRGKREVDEVEEIEEIDIEARGLLDPGQKDDIMDCMGNIANKFLTAIDSLQGFANCMKKVCPSYSDSLINGVAGCVGLAAGDGPGPKCDWMDFFTKKKMMIMNNRGGFGRCVRDQHQKCQ